MGGAEVDLVGLVPAAGRAKRLMKLPCSKELYPIGFRRDAGSAEFRTEVVSQQLLDKFRRGGVRRAYVVLRDGKWDIPAYFTDGATVGLSLAYVVITDSLGPPDTLDRAYSFVKNEPVAFGFPDILFGPDDVFERLRTRLRDTDAAAVLGLYPTDNPAAMDMVDADDEGQVRAMVLKPKTTTLKYTWACAVWRPVLTEFMHEFLMAERAKALEAAGSYSSIDAQGDLPVGAVLKRAVEEGHLVHAIAFPDQRCLDIGTPGNLVEAVGALRHDRVR